VLGASTISSAVPHIVAAAARGAGVDPALVLRAGGLDPAAPPRAEEHIDAARYFDVWRRVMALVGDPAFALRVASTFQLEDHEIFGFLAMSCETLGQAYQRTAMYQRAGRGVRRGRPPGRAHAHPRDDDRTDHDRRRRDRRDRPRV